MRGTTVTLRPLAAGDFKMLHRWHGAPHLRPHYMRGELSLEEIVRKFTPRIDVGNTSGVRCRIAVMDGMPYGFVQWSPSRHWPDCGAMKAGITDGCSADYFIGNAAFLGLGLAERMLMAVADEVFAEMAAPDDVVCLAHDDGNSHAVRATRAAGFEAAATYRDGGAAHTVYVRRRDGG